MIRFAVFTDLHYDEIPDGDWRINELKNSITNQNLDFIVCLGDLCYPTEKNKAILSELEGWNLPVHYAIGNHDKEEYPLTQVIDFYHMKKDYYSFQYEKVKFIVLNAGYMKVENVCMPYSKANIDKKKDICDNASDTIALFC